MAGQFDRIVEELYNKVVLGKGYCDEVLSEEGLEYFKKLIESYEKPGLIESYQNGPSWYRIYRDGWCEQGGFISMYSSNTAIALLKPYSNTSYNVLISFGGSIVRDQVPTIHGKTMTDFKVVHSAGLNNGFGLYWQTTGYIS